VLSSLSQCIRSTGFAARRFLSCECFDAIESLEEFESLLCPLAWFFLRLQGLYESASRMSKATEVSHVLDCSPRAVAVGHHHAFVVREKRLGILLATSGLIVEQHHRLGAILPASIQPHIRLALRGFARLLQHLNGGLVAMNQWLRQQGLAYRLIEAVQMQLRWLDDPVS